MKGEKNQLNKKESELFKEELRKTMSEKDINSFKKGIDNLFNKKFEESNKIFDKLLEKYPDNAYLLNYKGVNLYYFKKFDDALKYFNKSLKIKEIPDTIFNIGLLHLAFGKSKESIKYFERTIFIDNKHPKAHFELGTALADLEFYNEALILYEEALSLNFKPTAEYWFNKGEILKRLNEYENAIECFDNSIKIKENKDDAWLGKGNCFYNLKKYEDAIQCYDKVLNIKNSSFISQAITNKGVALYDLKKIKEAIQCFKNALKINPNNSMALGNLKIINKRGLMDEK